MNSIQKNHIKTVFFLFQKSQQRYCLLFKASRHGIERLEICESRDDKNPKIITLENCVKITQEPPPSNLIQIVKRSDTLTLNALSEEDLKEWVTALQSVAFKDKSSNNPTRSNTAIEEDNDLYCSSYGDGLFFVTLIPSDASRRCNFEAKTYMLHLTVTELQLKSMEDLSIIISKWPYRFIRKYGYRDGKFTFEAGRKCDSGEGVFILDHSNPQEVFRCMSSKMKSMKKLISGESLNSLECSASENPLNIASSMEPGSRSPLPPSPSNPNEPFMEPNSTTTSISLRGFLSSNDSLNTVSVTTSASSTASAIKPVKPPRKPLPKLEFTTTNKPALPQKSPPKPADIIKKFQNYEPVTITTSGSTVILKSPSPEVPSKPLPQIINNNSIDIPPNLPLRNESTVKTPLREYESIKTITDAWKTQGVGDIKHTERIEDLKDLIDFKWAQPQQQTKSKKQLQMDEDTYDKLDFLPAKNPISDDYKTIANTNIVSTKSIKSKVNDYELIASPNGNGPNESYLNGGFVRQPSIPGPQVPTKSSNNITKTMINEKDIKSLDHRHCNGMNYAIVSKPKRV